ncbi:MAG: hypothetical protein QXF88_01290 [Candidatus Aenigmatarchaeota archaeon]
MCLNTSNHYIRITGNQSVAEISNAFRSNGIYEASMDGSTVTFGEGIIQITPQNQQVAHNLAKEGLYRIRMVGDKYIIEKLN